jgi:hypothetical protein
MVTHSRFFILFLLIVALAVAAFAAPAQAQAAPQQQSGGVNFGGVWLSRQCEPRPGGPFATREMIIEGKSFTSIVTAFRDGKCSIPSLRMRVEGTLVFRSLVPDLPGAYAVDFQWKQVFLRPERTPEADFLNISRPGLCGTAAWSVGGEQDLGPTNGCRILAIDLRRGITEFDIALVSGDQLLLGERPADGGLLFSPTRRPFGFTLPLVKYTDVLVPTFAPTFGAPASPLLPETGGASGGNAKPRTKPKP